MTLRPFAPFIALGLALAAQAAQATSFELAPDPALPQPALAGNFPNAGDVWRGIAQSFTALDARTSFSAHFVGLVDETVAVDLTLLAGELDTSAVLTRTRAWLPAGAVARQGWLAFDLSAVALTPGARYTALLTLPGGELPAPGHESGMAFSVGWMTGSAHPYTDGALFGYGSGGSHALTVIDGFEADMAFRLDAATAPVPEPASAALLLGGLLGLAGWRRARATSTTRSTDA